MPPTIRYRVSLVCSHCDNLNDERNIDLATSGLGADPIDTSAYLGSTLELALEDFADGFLTLRTPADDEQTLIALEIWGCGVCKRLQVARLEFRRRTRHVMELVGATPGSFSTEALGAAHYISRELRIWAAQPGDDEKRLAELEAQL